MAEVLKEAIEGLNKNISAEDRELAVSALDAILSVDASVVEEVEAKLFKALDDHKKFWESQDTNIALSDVKTKDANLFKRLAAEQRVLIGLKQVDEEVLLGILNNNDNELKEYIGKQVQLGKLDTVSGWKTGSPSVSSKDLLSDYCLPAIKKNAAEALLALKPAVTTDSTLLKGLVSGKDLVEVNRAMKAFGFSHDLTSIPAELQEAARKLYVKSAYSALLKAPNVFPELCIYLEKTSNLKAYMQHTLALDKINSDEVKGARAELKRAFDNYVKEAYSVYLTGVGATTESLDNLKAPLIGDDSVFSTHMRTKLGLPADVRFSSERIKSARTELSTFYLERKFTDVLLVLKAEDIAKEINQIDDVAKMVTFIGKPPLSESDIKITSVVTGTSLNNFKLLMLNQFIAKLPIDKVAALEELQTVTELNRLKPVLEQMGIKPVNWVDAAMVTTIKDAGKARLKVIRVEQVASYSEKIAELKNINDLIRYAKISSLAEFKKCFREEPAWMDTPQMQQLQQQMRNRALDLKIASLDKFGAEQHTKLRNVLHRLPADKQLELLKSDNHALKHLLRSRDAARIKHYLGDTSKLDAGFSSTVDGLVIEIIEENERVASFQKVQNSAFAKLLAHFGTSFKPDDPDEAGRKLANCPTIQKLTDEDIKALNEQLRATSIDANALAEIVIKPPFYTESTQEKTKKALVNYISGDPEKTVIETQRDIHKILAEMYPTLQKESNKALFDVLLRLDADVTFNSNLSSNKKVFFDSLKPIFNQNHERVEHFIVEVSKVLAAPGTEANLEIALKKELSQAEYRNIVNTRNKELLAHNSGSPPERKTAVLTSIVNTRVNTMKDVQPLLELARPLEVFEKNQYTGPIYDVATREYGAVAKKAAYTERLEANTLTIDRLLRAQVQLQSCLDVLPADSTDSQINKIREKLDNDLKKLEEAKKQCQAAQDKIISTLDEINRIIAGKKRYLYNASDIVYEEMDAAAQQTFLSTIAAVSGSVRVPTEIAAQVALKDGETSYLSTVTENTDPTRPTIGQFRQTFTAGTHSEVNSEGRISQKVNVKVEMVKSPKDKDGRGPAHAQVNMYMNMALALIVANGNRPPTKDNPIHLSGGSDEEMECLWTALHIICKDKYDYKHEKFMESVKIDTGGFDPDKVMTKRHFREPVFNTDSQFTKIFDTGTMSKRALNIKLDDVDKIKAEQQKYLKKAESATKALGDYKAAMSTVRTEAALKAAGELREKDGVAANPECENQSRQQLGS